MGDGTQYTVNNQMVNATLMNIADNPTNVQLPGVYKKVCTKTLHAPVLHDSLLLPCTCCPAFLGQHTGRPVHGKLSAFERARSLFSICKLGCQSQHGMR
jgi:hypothetical protein